MNIFNVVILTLLAYSLIATIIYIITGEREAVAVAFGLGPIGLTVWCISQCYYKLKNKFKYRINKRSIFKEKETGKKYQCKVKDSHDVEWMRGYEIVKRYATKEEWKDIPCFSAEFIKSSKRNCGNCKYDKECIYDYPRNMIRCKNNYGTIIEFDKFEKL